MDVQSSKFTDKSSTNDKGPASGEARAKLGQEAFGRPPQRNSEGEASAKPTARSRFDGTLTSPDGKTQHRVIDGNVLDTEGNSLASLDANGKVKTSGTDFADTAINSAFKDYVFVGNDNGNARSFVCDQRICSGKIFLPDGSGRNIEHEVHLGMIINKSTGKQIGLITPPQETQDGHLQAGQLIIGEPPQQIPLSACTGVVFDLKVEGQTGIEGRRIQGIALGMDKVGERDAADRFLNLQDARADQEKLIANSLAKSEAASGFRPIDWLSGAQETNENTFLQERETAKRNITLYDQVIQTGQINDGLIKSLEGISVSAKVELGGRSDKIATPDDGATIAIPHITQENANTVNGRIRVGDEVYEIKQGDLYRVNQYNGLPITDPVKSGRLEPGYILQIDGRPACALASENRVLMEFTVGESSEQHQLIGLGARRHTDAIGFVPGGLVDVRELARQAEVTKANAAKANLEYFNNRPYITGRLANWAMGDREAVLSDFAHNIERQKSLLDGQTARIFASGFEPSMSNNQLDHFVASVQLIAHNIGATGTSGRQLAQEGQRMQQMVADSATIAAITVATAGAGAVISGAVNAGRIGVIAGAGVELTAGAGTGAVVSTVLRASDSSDWRTNALGGAIEGGAMAFGSAGGKLFGNMAQLKRSQTIASELRTGARVASSLSRQEQTLMNTAAGKLALAGYGDKTIKAANLGYKVADSVVQTTAFNGSHALRTGDTTHFNAKAIGLGSSAMLLGMGVGHGLDRTVGRFTAKAETAFAPAIGHENSALVWRAEQAGIGRRVANDTVNAYTNGAAASVGDALENERERLAQELKIDKNKLTNELFWQHAKLDNVLLSMHESGTMAAATAPGMSMGSHLLVSRINLKLEHTNRTEISTNPNQPERTIHPFVNERVAVLDVPQEGTRLSIDGRDVLVIATNPTNGEMIISGLEANHLGTAVALEPPLQVRRSQTDGWTRYDNLKGSPYYKNPDGKFYKVLSESQGQLLLLADYRLESVSAARAARQERTRVEQSQSRRESERAPTAELNFVELPNGIVAIKSRLGKWVEIYPAGHPKEHEAPTEVNGIYLQGSGGEIIKRTPIVDIVNHPDGRVELKHNPDFVQVIVPAGARPPSNAFITRVNTALMSIPSQLRLIVAAHGGRVKMSSLSTDVRPQLRGEQPRGHRRGNTWSMVPGFHDPINHDIVIAERRRIDGSYHQRMVEPEAIVYHEFGHAADSALGNLSEHPDFVAAYERDLAAGTRRMTSSERAEFDYFIQLDPNRPNVSTRAGRQELFAEIFAGLMGRTSIDYNRLTKELVRAKPKCSDMRLYFRC